MTLHLAQPSLRSAVTQVLDLCRRIDAEGLAHQDRVNAAISHLVDTAEAPWPLALQRQILTEATRILTEEAGEAPTPEPDPAPAPAPAPRQTLRANAPAAQNPTAAQSAKPAPAAAIRTTQSGNDMMALSNMVIADMSNTADFADMASLPRDEQDKMIREAIRQMSDRRKLHLNGQDITDLVGIVLADMLGLGPLEPLLADPDISDIMVNGPHQIFVERHGKLELTGITFRDNAHVVAIATRIVAAVGRRIDEAQPMVDARLKDGSRVNVTVPPLAIDGATITIRKFPAAPVQLSRLVKGGSLSPQMAGFLELAAFLRLNILVSGGTGSGKTTLMNAMSQFIPEGERVVTIEDAAELRFQQPHVVRFETRPPNVEGTGEVTMRTLVRNALRMRPDRIIIGEIRGDEVLDLMQAMNTGHDGSMSTLHANSPREALTRVESMAALAGFAPGGGVVRRQLVDAVNLIVQVSRMRDGKRRITSISEIAGLEGDSITLQELFAFVPDPDSTRTEVKGRYVYSGYRPKFATRAADYGVSADLDAVLGG
ncbi:CpaF family protein [Loktanella sp. TSTF-M6]|uniref:CpaF family protein n=1 Tax=Loktanella gaetbuli TaxID=2881335 RepID=A0ABS8BY18_9RHOB|nr:CpaF family protein [Loktanella gaetbuli]MCB5200636.1 CpaF family protein [Loktanella gaetbuli]